MPITTDKITRRKFLSTAAAVTAAVPASAQIVKRHVVGGKGHTPPSETIYVAGIGVGGMGGGDILQARHAGAKVVALCDVDQRRARSTFKTIPDAVQYDDFRRLLEKEKGIDAVTVATPDHMHAFITLSAMELGKHVYCEKPLAHTMQEVRAVTEAARRHGVVTQLGNQGRSFESTQTFVECIQSGTLGPIREVHLYEAGHIRCHIDKLGKLNERHNIPQELNWDNWLGSAPHRPFNPMYLPQVWRGWSQFGSGMLGDWFCHLADPVYLALGLKAPTSAIAEADGFNPVVHAETFPQSTHARFEFSAANDRPPVSLHWYDGDHYAPPRPEELAPNDPFIPVPATSWSYGKPFGALVVGDRGKIIYGSHGATGWHMIHHVDRSVLEADRKRAAEAKESLSGLPHMKNWLEACKTGSTANSDFAYGGPLTEVAMLGNVAIRMLGEELHWDPESMRITNNENANRHLSMNYRHGWDERIGTMG
jgi:hypothetical protein